MVCSVPLIIWYGWRLIIGKGDLGTTAKEVETALETTFALANRWDCILLLDEADVFLSQRTKEDFQRNGLVAGRQIRIIGRQT